MRSLVRWSHADCHSPRCQPYQCGGLLNATDVDYRTLATLCSSCACSGCELPPFAPREQKAAPTGSSSALRTASRALVVVGGAALGLAAAAATRGWRRNKAPARGGGGPRHRPVAQAEEVEGLAMDLD